MVVLVCELTAIAMGLVSVLFGSLPGVGLGIIIGCITIAKAIAAKK